MRDYAKALNYEFQRLELEATAFKGPSRHGKTFIVARGGKVAVRGYAALMCLGGLKTASPWNERMDALTNALTQED